MELKSGDKVIVNLGRKFAGSLVKATFKYYEEDGLSMGLKLCVIVPEEVVKDTCGFTNWTLGNNMLVETKQVKKL